MHDSNFLSTWLRQEGEVKDGNMVEMDEETQEATSKKIIREEEKEENETVSADRKCVNLVSVVAFEIFSQGVIGRVMVDFHWRIFWFRQMTCLIVILSLGRVCALCLMWGFGLGIC